ncbi:hypothetical protein FHS76_001928 [Ochrobactrum daejeonense]|uniref:Uncharacterized protein n=1 Tax=Brucella daejeonensis TaxID=659015 RepID=A0A7W9AWU4_9HYPH|nr:hypothetical protein [Brucella daejeonensis]
MTVSLWPIPAQAPAAGNALVLTSLTGRDLPGLSFYEIYLAKSETHGV